MVDLNPEQEKSLEEMRGWLDENEVHYREAQDKLTNPEFVKRILHNINVWSNELMGFNPVQHEERVAVYVVGRTQQNLYPLLKDIEFVEQFEEERARYQEAVVEMENAQEANSPT